MCHKPGRGAKGRLGIWRGNGEWPRVGTTEAVKRLRIGRLEHLIWGSMLSLHLSGNKAWEEGLSRISRVGCGWVAFQDTAPQPRTQQGQSCLLMFLDLSIASSVLSP